MTKNYIVKIKFAKLKIDHDFYSCGLNYKTIIDLGNIKLLIYWFFLKYLSFETFSVVNKDHSHFYFKFYKKQFSWKFQIYQYFSYSVKNPSKGKYSEIIC